ncbi:unnamed protein product [Protopolystoma xenopodis]|uniref:Serpin domain-containing protein n=1 Tax=Protopolystoma xenopodis TaxID=117903 RepID=A0A3S5FDX3_9PLAT|nr:unnamed protein product [Protopolystoma xenopodis]
MVPAENGANNVVVSPLGIMLLLASMIGGRGLGGKSQSQVMRGLDQLIGIPFSHISEPRVGVTLGDYLVEKTEKDGGNTKVNLLTCSDISPERIPQLQSLYGTYFLKVLQQTVGTGDTNCLTLPDSTFCFASIMYNQIGYNINKDFQTILHDDYKFLVKQIDFGNSQAAADEINRWCADNTNNTVNEIIMAREITPDYKLGLLNAVYFKGKYETDKINLLNIFFITKDRLQLSNY